VNWRAVLAGAIALALLEAVLAKRGATAQIGGAETGIVHVVQDFLDPSKPTFSAAQVQAGQQALGHTGGGGGLFGQKPSGIPWWLDPLGTKVPIFGLPALHSKKKKKAANPAVYA
jgi:hypothetical protein